ncbi:unnamed protein product [Rotaria sp. Silwood1]|nr:unnamed protein product [Rotaria sp. Silwood1]CAF1299070.1 unnamed protein product [Rotaria sp. Silwood1]CAF3467652.1 unnamed protein product [Rotaria sp. Silwood1]CAF3513647.1 unnamed protein product [Rotaria sp. Silwood1]CAF4738819.1 unnamed protein product [Rotaria sp. Silwood1]
MSNLSTSRTRGEETIYKTQEWQNLTTNNHNIINGNSSENYIENFTDLSNTEKSLVLRQVAQNLKTNPIRKPNLDDDFNERILNLIKNNVYDGISQLDITDNSLPKQNDNILKKIYDEIVDILHQWSDNKYKLHTFFNHSLPHSIRFVSWYPYLSNIKHREKFLNDLATDPRIVLSPMDSEVQRNSDRLIGMLPSAPDMINSKGNMNAVKAILSYHRSLFPYRHDLSNAEYFYAIPIVLSHNTPLSSSEESYLTSLAILIEMYETFLETIPSILCNIYSNNSTEELEPWFCCLTTNSLLFVWDQYLITRDISEFHNELLPAIATAIIIALKDLLMKCKKTSEIEFILQNKPTMIETHQLQSIIAQFFLPNLRYRINSQLSIGPHITNPQELDVKNNPLYNLLRKITQTCNRIAHGEGENNSILNMQTINNIHIKKFDLKMAEREVIGRISSKNECNTLTFEQQQRYNPAIIKVVKKRIDQRYLNELK